MKLFLMLFLPVCLHAQITITFAGDTTLGEDSRRMQGKKVFSTQFEKLSLTPESFLEGVNTIFAHSDITVFNLEGPITSEEYADKKYAFRGKPEYADILSKCPSYHNVVDLENNHMLDCGWQGRLDTKKTLKEKNIKFFDRTPLFIKIFDTDDNKWHTVGFIGFQEWNVLYGGGSNGLRKMGERIRKARKKCDLLVVCFHWGIEREYTHSNNQELLAHTAISAGAELVVGHHPHVVQDADIINGRPVIYSLGNFLFGGNVNPKDKKAILYQYTWKALENGEYTYDDEFIPIYISSSKKVNDYHPILREVKNGISGQK